MKEKSMMIGLLVIIFSASLITFDKKNLVLGQNKLKFIQKIITLEDANILDLIDNNYFGRPLLLYNEICQHSKFFYPNYEFLSGLLYF